MEKHPGGIKEFDLILELEKEGFSEFSKEHRLSDLSLFQTHFFLFHVLYTLRDILLEKRRYSLTINCLRICLGPYQEVPDLGQIARADRLREYYLDLTNLETTDADTVHDMLERFWRKFHLLGKKKAALETLGVDAKASFTEIKKVYHKLAMEHHPDQGGDAERFRTITEAMDILTADYQVSRQLRDCS